MGQLVVAVVYVWVCGCVVYRSPQTRSSLGSFSIYGSSLCPNLRKAIARLAQFSPMKGVANRPDRLVHVCGERGTS